MGSFSAAETVKTSVARTDTLTGEITSNECVKTELREITCNPGKVLLLSKEATVAACWICNSCCPIAPFRSLSTRYQFILFNGECQLQPRIVQHLWRLSMLPLSLKLIEREYKAWSWESDIQNIEFNYALLTIEIQKFAQVRQVKYWLLPGTWQWGSRMTCSQSEIKAEMSKQTRNVITNCCTCGIKRKDSLTK